jgi:hypothetical protein
MMKRMMARPAVWAVALLLAAACGKENDNNNNPVGGGGTPGSGAEITRVEQLTSASDRNSLVGKTVTLDSAPVTDVVGTYTFWIGGRNSGIPVVRQDRINGPVTTHVRPGGRARIIGTVRLASAVESGDQMWRSINSDERRDIEGAKVFIRADRVEPLN